MKPIVHYTENRKEKGMNYKIDLIRFNLILFIISIVILTLSARSCLKRNNSNTKSGSSTDYSTFVINAPSNLTATAISSSQINLSWQDNSNNEDGFEIDRSIDSINYALLLTLNADTTAYSDISVTWYTAYYYRVRAFNTIGDRSDYSNTVGAFTFDYAWIFPCTAIAAGQFYTLALRSDGRLWSWGRNDYGQLGLRDTTSPYISFPALIEYDIAWNVFANITALSAGYTHCIALKNNGSLWSWGSNNYGQLGLGDTSLTATPYPVTGTTSAGFDLDWSSVAAGNSFTVALKSNNTLWAWGFNMSGQLGDGSTDINPSTSKKTIPTQIGTESDWFSISAGNIHTIALKLNQTLWVWGGNDSGQLGDGTTDNRNTPMQIGTESNWNNISAGYSHTIGIKTNNPPAGEAGTLWAWGRNDSGQLGDGTNDTRYTPRQVGSESDWVISSAGGFHTIARKTNNTLWAWGQNDYGQLGLGDSGSSTNRNTPTQVGNNSDWFSVIAVYQYSLGLKTNGTIWVWGRNDYYQLGLGDAVNRNIPYALGSPVTPSSLIIINISSARIDILWTDNSYNEIGFIIERKIGATGEWQEIATVGQNVILYSDTTVTPGNTYYYRFKSYNNFGYSPYSNEVNAMATILAPSNLILDLVSTSQINLSWTDNSSDETGFKVERKIGSNGTYQSIGETGVNITTYSDITPAGFVSNTTYYYRVKAFNIDTESTYSNERSIIIAEGDWLTIASGRNHNVALKIDNTLWSWGWNDKGQLGLGDSGSGKERTTPTQIDASADWSTVSAGWLHTLGIKTNPAGGGTLWSWGWNLYGQLGVADKVNRITPSLVAGSYTDWVSATAGFGHTLGLKTNGTIWAWGDNSYNQLGFYDITGITTPRQLGTQSDWLAVSGANLSTIAAGYNHSLALKRDGILWSWGQNNYGQLGLGYTSPKNTPTQVGNQTDWVSIAGGLSYSIGLKSNGTVWSWGLNDVGELGLGDNTNRDTPSQVGSEIYWLIIEANGNHTLGLKTNGTFWAWGNNQYGQLGLGDFEWRNTPSQVGTEINWTGIAGGNLHSISLQANGTLWSWGYNANGQLGLGDTIDRNVPTLVGE
jgi:alpha-tubulin suppressor-like RCC1 family protein